MPEQLGGAVLADISSDASEKNPFRHVAALGWKSSHKLAKRKLGE
ncbi:MAG: hypothetical protein WCO50_05625 [Synechococcus sp. ELA619]